MTTGKECRLGLGCSGMARRNEEQSVRTVDAALDHGVTMFNVAEFYQNGESEIVLGNALRQHPRGSYFVNVKFGALPSAKALYGLDMNPFNIRAHLIYSLHRLGLDYVDLYEPSRMDGKYPVEDVVGEIGKLVDEGLVRHIGMTECSAEELRRANSVHPIYMFEKEYSLVDRRMEAEDIPTANELGIPVLAYGLLAHGLLTDRTAESGQVTANLGFLFKPEDTDHNVAIVRQLKEIADSKHVSTSNLAIAWALQKHPQMMALVGTTHPDHLVDSLTALDVIFTADELALIDTLFAPGSIRGGRLPRQTYMDGRVVKMDW